MRRTIFHFWLITAAFLLAPGPMSHGKVIYVDDDAPLGGDGASWTTAYRFLQDALIQAEVGDEIRLAQGQYRPDRSSQAPEGSGDRESSFVLLEGVTVKGGYAGLTSGEPDARDVDSYEAVLSGDLSGDDVAMDDPALFRDEPSREDNSLNVVTAGPSTVLGGLVITAGHAQPYKCAGPNCPDVVRAPGFNGGGVLIEADNVTVSECRLHHNFAEYGGGGMSVYRSQGVLLEDCVLERNGVHGPTGGGGLSIDRSGVEIKGCQFSVNWANGPGGGLESSDSDITISCCVFGRNKTRYYGGGLSVREGTVSVRETLLSGNASQDRGGGFSSTIADVVLRACSVIGNSSSTTGGGGTLAGGTMLLSQCLFSGNSTQGYGGALCASQWISLDIVDSTFAGNRATFGAFLSGNHNLSHQTSNPAFVGGCIVFNGGQEIYNNQSNIMTEYTLIDQSDASILDVTDTIIWGEGNLEGDPYFVATGHWGENETPNDPNDDVFVVGDYHLKSQAGRWDALAESWVQDDVTSPCIDAGDPNSPIGYEPFPNGGVLNMGAYGGTEEASKSHFGEPPCETIIAGDINGDCRVNFADIAILLDHWLQTGERAPE